MPTSNACRCLPPPRGALTTTPHGTPAFFVTSRLFSYQNIFSNHFANKQRLLLLAPAKSRALPTPRFLYPVFSSQTAYSTIYPSNAARRLPPPRQGFPHTRRKKNIPQSPIRPMPLITFFAIAISTNQPPNMAGAIFAPAKSRALTTTPHGIPAFFTPCFLFTNSLFKPFIRQTPPGVCPVRVSPSPPRPRFFVTSHLFSYLNIFSNHLSTKQRLPLLAPALRGIPNPQAHHILCPPLNCRVRRINAPLSP